MAEPLTLKKLAEEKRPWRQHIGIYRIGKTAARKLGRRTVRAGHFFVRAGHFRGRDNDRSLSRNLSMN